MERFLIYLDQAAERSRQEAEKLRAADREDEANLTKIKINVYEICKTVFQALDSGCYLKKLSGLEAVWKAALDMAQEHGDVKRAVIEKLKLQILDECRKKYQEYGGE